MNTSVYIDGFNLYYGALKGTRYKWLNPKKLAQQIIPAGHVITKIKYFTARVSGASDPTAPKRQQIYFNALSTIREIEIHFGSFLSKTIWRPTVTLPVANKTINSPNPVILPSGQHSVDYTPIQQLAVGQYPKKGSRRHGKAPRPLPDALLTEVATMEEKGSDVNLASHLLNDAWKGRYDVAVVISNDTDLVAPIRMVTIERKKTVFVVCPSRFGASQPLVNVATHVRHINPTHLKTSQFDSPIRGTTIRKPATW